MEILSYEKKFNQNFGEQVVIFRRFTENMKERENRMSSHVIPHGDPPYMHLYGNWYRASQKKLPLYVLLNISGTKEQNYKLFSPTENWNQCANFEYRTIFVQFKGAEILTKQKWLLEEGNCNNLLFSNLNSEVFGKMIKINMN